MSDSEKEFESFVVSHPAGSFFQSPAFGRFQEKISGRGKAWKLIARNIKEGSGTSGKGAAEAEISAACLVIKQKLPFGLCWLWVPYGPLGFHKKIFADLALLAKKERAIFVRIEPAPDLLPENVETLKKIYKVRSAQDRYTPQRTLLLDIEPDEGKILAQMKPKGRYNIKVAIRHGVTVRQINNYSGKDFDEFHSILKKTGSRDGFGIHPKSFYQTLLKTFAQQDMASLLLAYSPQQKIIGGLIEVFYKKTATYYYGASDHEHKNLMAPYLLQWKAIKLAKERGARFYDFLGIAPENEKKHAWSGVTDFKKKFGGREVDYHGAFDIIYKPAWYMAMQTLKKGRKLLA